jgi:SAM-dependent methyltransferase
MLYLDAGCGRGVAAALAARRGVHVFCVDPSPEQLELAASALPAADFRAAALDQLPFPNGVFDSILAFDSLHRALDPHGAIRELARVCGRGGRIAIATPAAVANLNNGLESAIDLASLHPIDIGEVDYQPNALAPLQRMSFAIARK